MLSIPKYGWVNLSIGDWSDRASYLTNVSFDILEAFINLLQNRKVSSVSFDAEGWEYIIVFDFYDVYIIENKEEEPKLYHFDISAVSLAEEVYKDMKDNVYAWSLWDYGTQSEEDRLVEEKKLKEKLENLRLVIDKFKGLI